MTQHTKVFLGLGLGILLGLLADIFYSEQPLWIAGATAVAYPIGQIFLRLLFMAIIPLIFSGLVVSISSMNQSHRFGRVGVKMFAGAICVSLIAACLGIGLANFFQPGQHVRSYIELPPHAAAATLPQSHVSAQQLSTRFLDLIPVNPIAAATRAFDASYPPEQGLLALIVFSLVFGYALSTADPKKVKGLVEAIQGLHMVSIKLVTLGLKLAPFGVCALVFTSIQHFGIHILWTLAFYVGLVIFGLSLHLFGVYSLILYLFSAWRPFAFFKTIQEVMLTAFSTSSSSATLPHSIKVAEEKLQFNPSISNFVLTLGSTMNQNGSGLYEGITALFLAQCYGVELGIAQQFMVILMAMATSMGTAGVPGGSIPFLMIVLKSIGVPAEGVGLILGVERILDMCRTVVNVSGDLVLAAWINYSESNNSEGHQMQA